MSTLNLHCTIVSSWEDDKRAADKSQDEWNAKDILLTSKYYKLSRDEYIIMMAIGSAMKEWEEESVLALIDFALANDITPAILTNSILEFLVNVDNFNKFKFFKQIEEKDVMLVISKKIYV